MAINNNNLYVFPNQAELPESLDNCFFIAGETHKRNIPLKNVFDAVVKTAKESGLTVELQSERIVFITNKDTIK